MIYRIIFFLFLLFFVLMATLVWYQLKGKRSGNPWALGSNYEVRGIDLSHHNGQVKYDELDSLDFVFLKVTEGSSWIDKNFQKHYNAFRKQGVAVGAYHFFRFDIEGKDQAKHFLNQLEGVKLQIPLIVDVEQDNNPYIDQKDVVRKLHAFMKEVKKHTGLKPIIYTNGDGFSRFIESDFSDHTLWLSSTNAWRPTLMECTFWQFNIEADLPAITHEVDLNVFRGTRQEWEEYLNIHKPYVVMAEM